MFKRPALLLALMLIGGLSIIGAIVFTLNASLDAVVRKTNEHDAEQTGRSVHAALSSATVNLAGVVTDNAHWTSAYERMQSPEPDQEWLTETWDAVGDPNNNYDGVAILNPDMSVWWGHGMSIDEKGDAWRIFRDRLLHDGFAFPAADNQIVKGIVDLGGDFALVVAERIRPSKGDPVASHAFERALVMYKLIDADLLSSLSSIFDIEGIAVKRHFHDGHTGIDPADLQAGIDLTSPSGRTIARLTWQLRNPGEAAIAVVRPKVLSILVAVCMMVAVFVAALMIGLRKLAKSERKAREASLTDPLMQMPNRHALHYRVEEYFHPKQRFKLLLIDLDRFKMVNDTYGHAVGDKLLIQVAQRVRATIGSTGFAARLGGDELAVLVFGDLDMSIAVANKIIASMQQPFAIEGMTLSVGCSVGMCCSDDAADPSELLKHADLAMYEAKRGGGGTAACYQPGMLEVAHERSRIEADLRVAIEQDQLRLAYQPIMRLADNEIAGYEALIRWHHPTRGIVSPVTFIPLAEETGQIIAIGEWVLREACRQAASWPARQRVAVNVSPAQFRSPLLLSHIVAALTDSGLPPHRLEVELTETAMVEDGERIAHVLTALRTLGVSVAMDDFGTGYSSLAHLRDFPLDRIKIDRSFVATAATDPHSMAVLKGIIQISHDLGTLLVGEGVETTEQLELLRSLGCDCVQGYLIGRPAETARYGLGRLSA